VRRFEPAPPDVKGATVLVVDDERAWRTVLETDLRLLGYEVVTAADAGEALEHVSSAKPALAIVDLMLPEPVDGRELVRRLRARGDRVPVVFYSARGTVLNEDGPDTPAFFSKAADRADLYASLPELIRRGAEPVV
jgi:DNA-binding response OmpR family regulator